MLEKFIKSLGYLGIDASNVNHTQDEAFMFKFEDKVIDKQWRCAYAFYKTGCEDMCNKIATIAIQEIGK